MTKHEFQPVLIDRYQFNEADHPRGQPANEGQFVDKDESKGKSVKTKVNYERLSSGCYRSKDGRIEINQLPDGDWAWAVDGVGYDAESTLKSAKTAAEKAAS